MLLLHADKFLCTTLCLDNSTYSCTTFPMLFSVLNLKFPLAEIVTCFLTIGRYSDGYSLVDRYTDVVQQ